jgi:uncharacterized protein YcfJ
MLGNSVENRPDAEVAPSTAEKCTVKNRMESRNAGYEVVYEYGGKTQKVVTQRDPGKRIQVQVTPVL